jgi:hypothetical protein
MASRVWDVCHFSLREQFKLGLLRYGKCISDIDAGYSFETLINKPEKGHDIKA